jgi:flagellar hook-associated protein 1 FlgK
MSIWSTLNIAKGALATAQMSVQVTSHNIANVDTEGYSRQEAVLEEATPKPSAVGLMGDGVTVRKIKSYFDQNLQNEINAKNCNLEEQKVYSQYLSRIEGVFNEDNSQLSTTITTFFNDWQNLSTDATSVADKQTVASDGENLSRVVNGMYTDLMDLQTEINGDVGTAVDNVNGILTSIASLNQQIAEATVGTSEANDYVDQRNQLIQQLSGYMDINYFPDNRNMVTILNKSGQALVEGQRTTTLSKMVDPDTGLTRVGWQNASGEVADITDYIEGGTLGGLLSIRDDTIKEYVGNLNGLAKSVIENVNYFHQQGNGGTSDKTQDTGTFFQWITDGNYAKNMRLSYEVEDASGNIQAQNVMTTSSTAKPTDNDIAVRIASLANENILAGSTLSSKVFTSASTGLGLSGDFVVNGVAVAVGPTDTLTQIAARITASSSGVSAQVVSATGGYKLVLGAPSGQTNLSVVNGTLDTSASAASFLQTLTSTVVSDPATTAAGLTGSFSLDGTTISVTSGQTLSQIAAAINGTAGVTARAVVSTDSTSGYKLTILAAGTAPSAAQPNVSWEQASPSAPIAADDPNTLSLPGGVTITFEAGQSLKDVANTINSYKSTTGVFASITQDAGNANAYQLVLYPTSGVVPVSGAITKGLGLFGSNYVDSTASVVAKIGQATKSANTQEDYYTSALSTLKQQRADVAGVSIDEEMANLIKFQNAYQAAARLYSVADSMLNTLMNAVGVAT